MSDSTTILENMRALSLLSAAQAGDPITSARINGIVSGPDNFVQAQDGFQNIAFDDDVGDAAFVMNYDATTNAMTLQNLTSGEISSAALGAAAIAQNETQTVRFDSLGATFELNSAFDKTSDIESSSSYSATVGGGEIDTDSVELVFATSDGASGLTSNVMIVDGTSANNAVLTIAGYSETGVDLTSTGVKTATLTDGIDAFTIEFVVTDVFSDTDAGGLELGALGTMVFADAGIEPELEIPTLVAEFSRVDTVLNNLDSTSNVLELADGFESFSFDADVQEAAMLVSYDASSRVLRLDNLTDGLTQAVAIGGAIGVGSTRSISFADLGATVVLNDDFDDTSDIARKGATLVSSSSSVGVLLGSIEFESASSAGGLALTGTQLEIDATTANTARLTIGGFSEIGVDLTNSGTKTETLTDGTDSFTITFIVTSAFSNSDDVTLDIGQIGQMVFTEPRLPIIQRGGALAEVFDGTADDDIAFAGGGDDNISGAGGADDLRGQDGDDTLSGEAGDDSLFGGVGNDTIDGGDDADMLRGGGGIDILLGGSGDDRLYGDDGDDSLSGGAGSDFLKGGAGADTILGGDGDDIVFGGDGEDDIEGENGADELYGQGDADDLNGGDGDDLIVGGAANDTIAGGADNDTLNGNSGDDVIDGDGGDDRLRGGSDDDVLDGGAGADSLFGDNGADVLTGGAGADFLKGGAGADVFRYIDGAEGDRIADYEDGVDRIDFSFRSNANAFGDLTITAINGGADTFITITAEGTNANAILVSGVNSSVFDAGDFIF